MADLGSTRVFGKLTVMHDAIVKANAEITGSVTAASFAGDGSLITALNAAAIATGTVPDARLPTTATRWPAWSEVTSKPNFVAVATSGAYSDLSGVPVNATPTVAGLMSSADKGKLDDVESGATADQTKADIDALGVDSDTVDGLHASQFLRSDQDAVLDAGASTALTLMSDDSGESVLNLVGSGQGTGRLFVGQSDTHGGGIEYNGDETPATTDAGSDYLTLWRRSAGIDSWTARNKYDSNTWEFREVPSVGGLQLWHPTNDGAGSGLDADLLDGHELSTIESEYKAYADQAEVDAKAYTDSVFASHDTATDPHTQYTTDAEATRIAEDQAFIYALIFG